MPIPSSIKNSPRKRLRLRKTLVYNPRVFPQDPDNYNPIRISACIHRDDDYQIEGFTTQSKQSAAYLKSNVKKYAPIEKSTNNDHMGKFWEIEVRCECKNNEDFKIPNNYKQNYSLVISIEDINQDESIDIHQEVSQMIDIDVEIPVEISL